MPDLDTQLACIVREPLAQMSPAGKIALAIFLIQEVAAEVAHKPVDLILDDMKKVLKVTPLHNLEDQR
jgi:hypothetical protein